MSKASTVRGLERGLQVLRALHLRPISALQELYAATSISKPSLLRILNTLEQGGLVSRRLADGRYRLSGNFAQFARKSSNRYDRVAEAAAPVLDRLCQQLAWPSDLAVPAGDHMENRETSRTHSPFIVFHDRIGHQINWLLSAVGRAYLAHCPAVEREKIVARLRRSRHSEDNLAHDAARLERVLADVRAHGYASRDSGFAGGFYGRPPYSDGLYAIAVPLLDGTRVHGAINLLWLRQAGSAEAFAKRHLADLRAAAAEIVSSLRRPMC
jgi:IclR family mhp operon transcriptional activator